MNSSAPAARAADSTSSGDASGCPNAMFERTEDGEQEAVVEDDTDLAAQRRPGDAANVMAVESD